MKERVGDEKLIIISVAVRGINGQIFVVLVTVPITTVSRTNEF